MKIEVKVNRKKFIEWATDENGISIETIAAVIINSGSFTEHDLMNCIEYIPSRFIINKNKIDIEDRSEIDEHSDSFEFYPDKRKYSISMVKPKK